MRQKLYSILVFILLPFLYPEFTFAHAFGTLYNLPVPFWLYLYGGAATIIISFFIIGFFLQDTKPIMNRKPQDLTKTFYGKLICSFPLRYLLKGVSLFLFFLTIVSGFIGTDIAIFNFNMNFFWIFFMLGLTYLTIFLGNIWPILNPWKTLLEIAEALFHRPFTERLSYPTWLSYSPALLFYLILIWLELISQTSPFSLSLILSEYTLLTFLGVFFLGKQVWFQYADFFSVFFRLVGYISPFTYSKGRINLQLPFQELLKEKASHFSLLFFTIFMLSSTAYDGFRETKPAGEMFHGIQHVMNGLSFSQYEIILYFLTPLVFVLLYFTFIYLTKLVTHTSYSVKELSLRFAFSLIPIAVVYNIAHYYTLILTEGQNMIRLISDPFGKKWDLFGTAHYPINLKIVDAGFTWHAQVGLIVFGHIVAVYVAHIISLYTFKNQKKAILSQIPMLILMVTYTIFGLWILSQPLMNG